MLEHYIAFCLFLALFHSLLEEYYWRWFVFGNLQKLFKSDIYAHLIAAVCFALHHIVVTTQFFPLTYGIVFGSFVGIGGYIWSQLYARFATLSASWISHIIVDLVILGVGYRIIHL
jgi:membrane protease YdiL (CAAX protease family)